MADDSSAVEPALVLDPDRLKEVRDVQCRELTQPCSVRAGRSVRLGRVSRVRSQR